MHTLPKRENKYKAWDGLLNKWASPTDIRPTDKRPDVITWAEGGALTITSHEDFTWVQFTGLLDKNGKEIWEGDLAKNPDGTTMLVELRDGWWLPFDWTNEVGYSAPNWEVIGNIFQNPELLK